MRSLRSSALFAFSLLLAAPAVAQDPQPPSHLVSVAVKDVRYLTRLLKLDLDLASCSVSETATKNVEVIATADDLATLKKNGFAYRFVIRDLDAHHQKQLAKFGFPSSDGAAPPAIGKGSMGGHFTLKEMEEHLDDLAKRFPKLCTKKVSIGKSIEKRDIWMVKISDNVVIDDKEPKVLFDALHHAREPLSMGTTILFMKELLEGYGKDPVATFIINNRQLYFVPCVNPDGYEYNRSIRPTGGGLWRKNRRKNNATTFGVDLNRNYATGFNAPNGGSSTSPSSNTYRGTKALSEPETAAMEAFAKKHSFVQVCSTHCHGDILLQPWGYQRGNPQNQNDYAALGKLHTAANGIRAGAASGILYVASGTALDQHHAVHKSISWSPELGTSAEGGFWPVGSNIIAIARRHQPMLRSIALSSGIHPVIDAVVTSEASGNNNGRLEPGESGQLVVTVKNNGILAMTKSLSLSLTSSTPGVTVTTSSTNLPAIGKLGMATNQLAPLRFSIGKQTTAPIAELQLKMISERGVQTLLVQVPLRPFRQTIDHDMEQDRGFARATGGTATTGLWERALPQATSSGSTTYQPGTQNTKGGKFCWITGASAGSGAGSNDVDGGYTDLITPTLDLAHLAIGKLSFAHWYAESLSNDDFELAISTDDGKSWSTLFRSATSTGQWRQVEVAVKQLTSTTRFRFRAQDQNSSLVEAGVDDVAISGPAADGDLTILTSGVAGSTLRAGFVGQPGGIIRPLVSPKLGTAVQIPGIGGSLLVDPTTTLILAPLTVGTSGYVALDVKLPKLTGATYYVQALYGDNNSARFGNLQRVVGK